LAVSQVPVTPCAVIRCRPIGALLMEDEHGRRWRGVRNASASARWSTTGHGRLDDRQPRIHRRPPPRRHAGARPSRPTHCLHPAAPIATIIPASGTPSTSCAPSVGVDRFDGFDGLLCLPDVFLKGYPARLMRRPVPEDRSVLPTVEELRKAFER
jgi:hypothetical protein